MTVYVWVVVFFEQPGLRHVTKSYRLDTSGRSEDKEAAAIAPIARKACDNCTVGHALRNPTHLPRRSADCEPCKPSFAAGLRDCWPWWSGWLWQDKHLPCNTTCNTTCNTQHATHMQHDMQHDTQHARKVEKTQGFFFFGHFATRPAFKNISVTLTFKK